MHLTVSLSQFYGYFKDSSPQNESDDSLHFQSLLYHYNVSVARIYSWNIDSTRRDKKFLPVDDLKASDFWTSSDLMGNNSHSSR
jgi:hypothetical protein